MALDLRSSELEHSFIKERITIVEKHLEDLSLKLSNYNKKLAQLRDSSDEFTNSILRFTSKENFNQSLKLSLNEFSDVFTALQEYRDAQIQRIDARIIRELANYGPVCKKIKDDLKRSYEARSTEFKKQTQLDKLRGKDPPNWPKISQAEKEANLAREEATYTTLEMSKRIDAFERKKLEVLKSAMLDFIKIEMMFNSKALELYTNAYSSVKNINIDEDLNEFRCHFKALTFSLDAGCLFDPDVIKKKIEDDPSTPISKQKDYRALFNGISDQKKEGHLNSNLNSKFDFGDQDL